MKNAMSKWTDDCQVPFDEMKERVTEEPPLAHLDPRKQSYLETNSSGHIGAGVLSQVGDDGVLHPVSYFSQVSEPGPM